MANIHKTSSFYSKTPIKSFYLDLWVEKPMTPQDDDLLVTISAEHHERPDQLAYAVYGTPNLFWIFWARNKDVIVDPIHDFKSGKEIYVPSLRYIQTQILV